MSETFKKTPRAIDHLYAYNYVYEFLEKNNLLNNHRESMVKLFCDCYFFGIAESYLKEVTVAVKGYDSACVCITNVDLTGNDILTNTLVRGDVNALR